MNTIGKILVLLNLLFALATGAFLVMDFAARKNWKEEAEHRKRLYDIAESNRATAIQLERQAIGDKKKLQEALDSALVNHNADDGRARIQLADLRKEYEQQKALAAEAIQSAKRADAEAKRRHDEVKMLGEVVQKREAEIAKAQEEAKNYRNQAQTSASDARTAILRAQSLLKQLQEKERQLVALQQKGPGGAGAPTIRDPKYSNPPAAYVKGKIEKVLPSRPDLVQVNIGSDAGVKDDNTLEVYRMQPRPEYLGRLLIVEAHHHMAIGRLVRQGGGAPALRVGDEVASTIK